MTRHTALGFTLVATLACAAAPVRTAAAPSPSAQLDPLRQDLSPRGRDALAKYLFGLVSADWATLPPGTTRAALCAEGLTAAVAAAQASPDLEGWIGLAHWLQIPWPFDPTAASVAVCSASDGQPTVELLAEECGDFRQRKGDVAGAVAVWRRAIDDAAQHVEAVRVIDKVLHVSLNPDRDLSGVSEDLIRQARIFHEQQREYALCLASCVGCVGRTCADPYAGCYSKCASNLN